MGTLIPPRKESATWPLIVPATNVSYVVIFTVPPSQFNKLFERLA